MRLANDRPLLKRLNRRDGFTLLEVLVVVAILVVLASIASIYVFSYLDNAKKDKAKLDATNILHVAESYMVRFGEPPTSMNMLLNPPDGSLPGLKGEAATMDPWNKQYQINVVGTETAPVIEIWTLAPDGKRISVK